MREKRGVQGTWPGGWTAPTALAGAHWGEKREEREREVEKEKERKRMERGEKRERIRAWFGPSTSPAITEPSRRPSGLGDSE